MVQDAKGHVAETKYALLIDNDDIPRRNDLPKFEPSPEFKEWEKKIVKAKGEELKRLIEEGPNRAVR